MANDWQVQVIESPDGSTQVNIDWPVSAGRLSFKPTGKVGGDMGCNSFQADWTAPVTDQIRVSWDGLGTAAECGEGGDWGAFPDALETVTGWEITQSQPRRNL